VDFVNIYKLIFENAAVQLCGRQTRKQYLKRQRNTTIPSALNGMPNLYFMKAACFTL
jgi:hypothetical protein